jgi:DNA end-binding protein Ku
MSSRSVGQVVISFGMAQIAIKLYNATGSESVSFNMISKTGNRVGQRLFEKIPTPNGEFDWGPEIQRGETLKGYEHAKDQFITFTDEEVDNMQAAKKNSLEIAEFIPTSEINPLQIEKTYYTAPDKGMDKGYRFLYEILKTHQRAAIGTYVARGKEHLVAIQAFQHGLVMYQLFYDKEVRSFDNKCANLPVSAIELAMGKVLMDTLFKPKFDSSKYADKFIDKLNKAVTAKLENPDVKIAAVNSPVTSVGMADTLRASLIAMGVPADQIDAMIAKAGVDPEPVAEPVAEKPARKPRVKKAS